MKKYLVCLGLCTPFFSLSSKAQTAAVKPPVTTVKSVAPTAAVKPPAQTTTKPVSTTTTTVKPVTQPATVKPVAQPVAAAVKPVAQPTATKPVVQPAAVQPATTSGTTTPFLPAKIAGTIVLKTPVGVAGQANGLKAGNILVSVDTTIHSNPRNPLPDGKMAYLSIDIINMTGTSQMEVLSGKQMFWVFDKAGKQVLMSSQLLKSIKAAMEDNIIDCMTVKIPYRLKTDKNIYTIHYRWESPDKRKNVDILTSK